MSVLAECPMCRKRQSLRNRLCACGEDLVKAKKSKRVRFWIAWRLPGGKQKREAVGFSIEEARDAEGKRRVQKRENRIFDIKPEAKMTFGELAEWFLGLEKVKSLAYYPTLQIHLSKFNSEFGNTIVGRIKPADVENYQTKRKGQGFSDSYIDQQISTAKNMIRKAFHNDLVGGDTLKAFDRVKKLLKRNANARVKVITLDQFNSLMEHLPPHTKQILATGFYTGMRRGEIMGLTWDKVDLKNRVIRLEANDTKDKEPRTIPILPGLHEILSRIPRPIQGGHVFLYKGEPVKDIRRSLKRACGLAGITHGRFVKDGFVFHDLRHTFNTFMRKAGVAESVIMSITGHSTREMFDRYNTVDSEDARLAMERLDAYFQAGVDQNVDQEPSGKKKETSRNQPTSRNSRKSQNRGGRI